MKNEEMDRVIAEHFGWEFIPCHDDGFGRATGETWRDPDGDIGPFPPSYSTDLNAMHEAEKALDDFQHDRMRNQLWLLMIKETKGEKTSRRVHSAEASERAEAFLRAIGKWVE